MLLLIDNYDSFTYNLYDYFLQLNNGCVVRRNDEIILEEIESLQPEAIIFSPGPEIPASAGIMMDCIKKFHSKIPLLGICLGHQGIGEFFGAELVKSEKPMHGKTSTAFHSGHTIFKNIPLPFQVMRYHSLLLKKIPKHELEVIAKTDADEVMAFVDRTKKICGLQFHPESILTPNGLQMLGNWLKWIKE